MNSKRYEILGQKLTIAGLAELARVSTKMMRERIESGMPPAEAVASFVDKPSDTCACGSRIQKPTHGPWPLRCDVCEVENRRAYARDQCRKRGATPRGRYTKTSDETKKHIEKRKKSHRAASKRTRLARKAKGLCQLCGQRPATSRCGTCKDLRKEADLARAERASTEKRIRLTAYEWCPDETTASGW